MSDKILSRGDFMEGPEALCGPEVWATLEALNDALILCDEARGWYRCEGEEKAQKAADVAVAPLREKGWSDSDT